MAGTTKTRTAPASELRAGDDELSAVVDDQLRLLKACDSICAKLADDKRDPTPGELVVLRRFAPSVERFAFSRWLDRQVGQWQNVRELQARAGSAADRAAARQAADEAERKHAESAPALEAQIAELQKQLGELAGEVRRTTGAVERQQKAVELLSAETLLPSYVADELNALRRAYSARFGGELTRAEARLGVIDKLLAFDVEADYEAIRLHIESNKDLGGDSTRRLVRFFEPRRFSEDDQELYAQSQRGQVRLTSEFFAGKVRRFEWNRYCDELKAEAETLKARIEELRPVEAAASAEIARRKSYHVPS